MPALTRIVIGDDPAAWRAAGFAVDGDGTQVGAVGLRFTGAAGDEPAGITGWAFAPDAGHPPPRPGTLDGLATTIVDPPAVTGGDGPVHLNTTVRLDHVVVLSPDVDRTTEVLGATGLDVRRVRPIPGSDPVRVQVFFRAGEVIIELVGPQEAAGDGPATFFGLAFTVTDLDTTAALLGEHLSEPRSAVQPGRQIATLRHRALGISVPVAFLSKRSPEDTPRAEAPGADALACR